jgi:hypothetical protein
VNLAVSPSSQAMLMTCIITLTIKNLEFPGKEYQEWFCFAWHPFYHGTHVSLLCIFLDQVANQNEAFLPSTIQPLCFCPFYTSRRWGLYRLEE